MRMKSFTMRVVASLVICWQLWGTAQTVLAQTFSTDSIISIVAARIARSELHPTQETYSKEDYESSFYIEDIGTREPFYGQAGVYEFGLYGDDLDRWIMRYDASGYKIYEHGLNTEMFGEIVNFCEKHKFSCSKFHEYMHGLHRSSVICEKVGEMEIKTK